MSEKTTNFRIEVGARLRQLRQHLDMRQEDIGDIIGMVTGGVSMIEKGERGLDPQDALRLRKATGATLDWIYGGIASALPKDIFKPLIAKKVTPANPKVVKKTA